MIPPKSSILLLAVLFVSTGPVLAQFEYAPSEADWSEEWAKKPLRGRIGIDLSDVRLPLEVTDVKAIDDDGVTPIVP